MGYKVIQWATGSMGKTILRGVIEHPDLELVGLYVYNPKKVGRDAGEIVRMGNTGVLATDNVDEILALDADIVIHSPMLQPPYSHHNEDICRLLASGKNVISINGHSYPQHWGKEYSASFSKACTQGQSSLFGSGLNPGFIAERIALVATGVCTSIDTVLVSEVVETNVMKNPEYVFGMLGFGSEPGEFDPNDPEWTPAQLMNGMYSEVVAHFASRMGMVLDRVETEHVMLPATTDIETNAGLIKKGTVSHTNWRWHGVVNGRRTITHTIHWIMEKAHLDNPDYHLWEVQIRGCPGVDIKMDLLEPENHQFKTTPEQYGVAGSIINAIPAVCEASPGILEMPSQDHFRQRF